MRQLIDDAKLKEIIFMKVGEASMCWSEIPNGVFESKKAEKIGYDILEAFILYLEDKLRTNNRF